MSVHFSQKERLPKRVPFKHVPSILCLLWCNLGWQLIKWKGTSKKTWMKIWYFLQASKHERAKNSPTYKDLDFMELLPEGLMLEAETYNALISTMRRDCRVLESFRIMDYSLLIGIHNLDQSAKEHVVSLEQARSTSYSCGFDWWDILVSMSLSFKPSLSMMYFFTKSSQKCPSHLVYLSAKLRFDFILVDWKV